MWEIAYQHWQDPGWPKIFAADRPFGADGPLGDPLDDPDERDPDPLTSADRIRGRAAPDAAARRQKRALATTDRIGPRTMAAITMIVTTIASRFDTFTRRS